MRLLSPKNPGKKMVMFERYNKEKKNDRHLLKEYTKELNTALSSCCLDREVELVRVNKKFTKHNISFFTAKEIILNNPK